MNIKADSLWIVNPNTLSSSEQQTNVNETKGRSYAIVSESSGLAKIGRLNKEAYTNQTHDFMQNSGKNLFSKELDITSHYTQATEALPQNSGKSSSFLNRSFKQITASIIETWKIPFTAVTSFLTSMNNRKNTQGNFEDLTNFKMNSVQYSNQFDQSEPESVVDQPFDTWVKTTQQSENLPNPRSFVGTSTFNNSLLTTNSSSAENFVKNLSDFDGRTRFVDDDEAFN